MKYYLIAGEASGDLHASNLMKALKREDPDADFRYFGGDLMAACGGTLVKHYRDMAYMGFIPVLMNLDKVLANMRLCKQDIAAWRPDVVILVDYPGFNLKIAKYVKSRLGLPVYYYISPKIWAWKEWRVKSIRRYVDRLYSILPFEVDFYARHHYAVEYVGNPTVDELAARPFADETFDEFVTACGLERKPIIALLAGSRVAEIKNNLPLMIEAAEAYPDYQLVVAGAPGIPLCPLFAGAPGEGGRGQDLPLAATKPGCTGHLGDRYARNRSAAGAAGGVLLGRRGQTVLQDFREDFAGALRFAGQSHSRCPRGVRTVGLPGYGRESAS